MSLQPVIENSCHLGRIVFVPTLVYAGAEVKWKCIWTDNSSKASVIMPGLGEEKANTILAYQGILINPGSQ
jgi:hypothetical protein